METKPARQNRIVEIVIFLLTFILLSRTPLDADLWWHLRAGQVMWEDRTILLVDQFSYTVPGIDWTNAFWASEIFLFIIFKLGGYFAIASFVSLTGAVTFGFLYKTLHGNQVINGLIILLSVLTAAPIWGPRPQIVSFLLLTFLDRWLEEGKNIPLWVLVPFFALWANLHGGWIWGFLLLLAQIAGSLINVLQQETRELKIQILKRTGSLMLWSALSAGAIGLNPNGIEIWKLPFQQVNVSMQIQEWLSPNFHRLDFHPLLWMVFALLVTAPFARGANSWTQLLKVIGFAYLAFVAQRNIALFAIVAAPLLSEWSNAAIQIATRKYPVSSPKDLPKPLTIPLNTSITILLAAIAIGRLYTLTLPPAVEANYPAGAINWLKTNRPEGRLFNSYNWGGYILWKLPTYPVFIDGRADMYGSNLISQWQDVANGRENASQILNTWRVNTILLEPGWPIINILEKESWEIAYQDELSVVLLRK